MPTLQLLKDVCRSFVFFTEAIHLSCVNFGSPWAYLQRQRVLGSLLHGSSGFAVCLLNVSIILEPLLKVLSELITILPVSDVVLSNPDQVLPQLISRVVKTRVSCILGIRYG